jgi:hypothetical protein
LLNELELVLHLVLEFDKEGFGDVADSGLRELFKGVTLALLVDFGKFFFKDGGTLFETFLQGAFKPFIGFLLGPLALALADVRPGTFDVGHCAAVDSINIAASQVEKHVSTQLFAVHNLRFNAVDDLASQGHELLHELGS